MRNYSESSIGRNHDATDTSPAVGQAELGLPARHPFGDFDTPRRFIEDPLRLVGARDYVPGDSFRRIHWKATARRRELQTKILDPSSSNPLAIFLNVRTSPYLGVNRDVLELAITTAASVAHWGWEAGHPVGLYVNTVLQSNGERIRMPSSSQVRSELRVSDQLPWPRFLSHNRRFETQRNQTRQEEYPMNAQPLGQQVGLSQAVL